MFYPYNINSVVWKNKETGEIITLTYYNHDHVILRDSKAMEVRMSVKNFVNLFEEVHVDIKKYKEQIIEACSIDKNFRNLAYALMRRLEPSYFSEGDIVYFTETGSFFDSTPRTSFRNNEFGPEYPYEITKITENVLNEYNNCLLIHLVRRGKKCSESDFILPIYLDRIVPGDAFWYLKRYDKAY